MSLDPNQTKIGIGKLVGLDTTNKKRFIGFLKDYDDEKIIIDIPRSKFFKSVTIKKNNIVRFLMCLHSNPVDSTERIIDEQKNKN